MYSIFNIHVCIVVVVVVVDVDRGVVGPLIVVFYVITCVVVVNCFVVVVVLVLFTLLLLMISHMLLILSVFSSSLIFMGYVVFVCLYCWYNDWLLCSLCYYGRCMLIYIDVYNVIIICTVRYVGRCRCYRKFRCCCLLLLMYVWLLWLHCRCFVFTVAVCYYVICCDC